jgi:hypothetical protein
MRVGDSFRRDLCSLSFVLGASCFVLLLELRCRKCEALRTKYKAQRTNLRQEKVVDGRLHVPYDPWQHWKGGDSKIYEF